MSDSTIGIKLADGSFYPILEEKKVGKKKLILTTARENQRSVQIDLYRGTGESLLDATYIGSLVIENLNPKPAGGAEVEFIVGVNEEGLLNAKAGDRESGEYQNFSVSMDTIVPQAQFDLPDLDLEGVSAPDVVREEEEQRPLPEEARLYGEEEERIAAPKRRPFFLIGFIVIALLIIGIVTLLIFRSCGGEDQRPLKAGDTAPPAVSAPAQPAQQSASSPASAQQAQQQSPQPAASPVPPQQAQQTTPTAAPVQPAPTPQPAAPAQPALEQPRQDELIVSGHPEAPEGVWYKIVWGDTLWDISIAFYRTPWLYGKIAKINSIPNPDRIYAGRRLFIPKE